MDDPLTQKIINSIEKKIKRFELKKYLEKKENPNLGIIYTPKEVVDYIVSNIFRIHFEDTFKYQIEAQRSFNLESSIRSIITYQKDQGNIVKIINKLRILDPACGSGRFLISVAEKLYKIHKILNPSLSDYDIKKFIICNNLYGNEIENSAYFISKLRILKWILSTNPESIDFNDLNLKKIDLIDFDQINEKIALKINIINSDFLLEFNSDKFDIIIGNPPYVENKKIKDVIFKKKLIERYRTAYRLFDLSILFLERSLELLKSYGYLSLILPNKFLSADYGIKIRNLLLNESEIREIINLSSLSIFQNTSTYPIILSLKKIKKSGVQDIKIRILKNINELSENCQTKTINFHQDLIRKFPSKVIPVSGNIEMIAYLFNNFNTFAKTFKDLKILYRPFGFLNYYKYFDNISNQRQSDDDLLLIGTGNIDKYYVRFNKRIKIAGKNIEVSYFNYNPNFEHIWNDLNSEKLIFREIAKDLTCCYDPGIFVNITGLYFIKIDSFTTDQLFGLLTILNSNLLDLVFKTLFSSLHMSGGYLRFNGSFIKRLPLPRKIPLFFSHLGKIIQLLSQLKYDLDSKEPHIIQNSKFERLKNTHYNQIQNNLHFFTQLSNSLVKLLYLDDFYLKSNLDYSILRGLFNLTTKPPINPYKFLLSRFNIKKYEIYSLDELDYILLKINALYNQLYNNPELLSQLEDILKNDF